MSSKINRLRTLAQSSPGAFPPTAWVASQLDEWPEVGSWYLRADDRYEGSTGPLSTQAVRQVMLEFGPAVAAQPLIEARLAGAMFVSGGHLLIEATQGDAMPLLRGGSPGVVILVEPRGRRWTNGELTGPRGSPGQSVSDLLALAAPYRTGGTGVIVEWIVDMDDRPWLVDLKSVSRSFIRWDVGLEHSTFYIGFGPHDPLPPTTAWAKAGAVLSDTGLQRTEVAELSNGVIWCESGAALSHLVTRLGVRGRRLCVRVEPGVWSSGAN